MNKTEQDKKEKIEAVKQKFRQQKENERQKTSEEPVKTLFQRFQSNVKKIWDRGQGRLQKTLAGLVFLGAFNMGAQAKDTHTEDTEDAKKTTLLTSKKHLLKHTDQMKKTYGVDSIQLVPTAQLEAQKNHGRYNGVDINFSQFNPEKVVHIFESGDNQTILNYGSKGIENAQALGEYQFNLNNTIYGLVKYCRKNFPELAQAAGVDIKTGRIKQRLARTQNFYQTYCKICKGARAQEFAKLKFQFMFASHFQPIFDKLHQDVADFPEITEKNYNKPENFLYSAQVMSTSTQSPARTFNIIKEGFEKAQEMAEEKGEDKVNPVDFYKNVSAHKSKIWGFSQRYKTEDKLAQDVQNYFLAQAELQRREQQADLKIEENKPQLLADINQKIVEQSHQELAEKMTNMSDEVKANPDTGQKNTSNVRKQGKKIGKLMSIVIKKRRSQKKKQELADSNSKEVLQKLRISSKKQENTKQRKIVIARKGHRVNKIAIRQVKERNSRS